MKIFIAGGTGFIGKPTVNELKRRGHSVFILSRAVHGGLSEISDWGDAVGDFSPDVALNLVWEGIPAFDIKTTATNVANTLNLFNFLAKIRCPKVITVSSCVEYEDPAREKHGFLREGKLFLARCAERYSAETDTKFIRALPFFVYGPGQREESLLPSVIKKLLNGQDPEVHRPTMAHDFVFVDDVAGALVGLAESEVVHGVYDVGTGSLKSVGEMVNTALAAFGREPMYDTSPESGDPVARTALIKNAIGWEPSTSVPQGISRMIEYYKTR